MDIRETLRNFRPGATISAEDYTPEVQEALIKAHFGDYSSIDNAPAQNNDEINNRLADYEEKTKRLEEITNFLSQPEIADAIGNAYTRRSTQPIHQVSQPQMQQPPPPAPQFNPNQTDGMNAPDSTNTNEPSQTEESDTDWWAKAFGDTSKDESTQTSDNQGMTQQPPMTPQSNTQPAPAQSQAPDPGEVVNAFVGKISAHAAAQGINPNEIIGFVNKLNDPAELINAYRAMNSPAPQRPAPESPNLAEERSPSGPISVHRGITDNLQTPNLLV